MVFTLAGSTAIHWQAGYQAAAYSSGTLGAGFPVRRTFLCSPHPSLSLVFVLPIFSPFHDDALNSYNSSVCEG